MIHRHFLSTKNIFSHQNKSCLIKPYQKLTTKIIFNVSEQKEKFSRLINFDAQYFDRVPFWLEPMDPAMVAIKDIIVQSNSFVGLPWWAVLIASSIVIRFSIFPLILVQMKRMSKFGPIFPIFVLMKDTWKRSQLSKWQKIKTLAKLYREVTKQQGLRFSTVLVYNIAYYPMLITMIFAIRKLLSQPQVANSTFLYLTNLAEIDPYYILPTLTIGMYYWNFERFITPENKDTLMSKIRVACQYFLILWYPFLCCWPSGIVIYMCTNAMMSILQSNLMRKPWFLNKIAPEVVEYNYILGTIEYDKGKSDTLIESIKLGEEDFKSKAIRQEEIVSQTEKMILQLNRESSQGKDTKINNFGLLQDEQDKKEHNQTQNKTKEQDQNSDKQEQIQKDKQKRKNNKKKQKTTN